MATASTTLRLRSGQASDEKDAKDGDGMGFTTKPFGHELRAEWGAQGPAQRSRNRNGLSHRYEQQTANSIWPRIGTDHH